MTRSIKIAPVHKSIVVRASTERAFEVFTAAIDRWWPKTHRIGGVPITESVIEPFVGGRWYTKRADGTDVTVGHIRLWEPAKRFIVGWEISSTWQPDPRLEFSSEVEVRFVAESPGFTRVEVEHRDFERMGAADGETMRNQVDSGWPGLLALFAGHVEQPTN